MKSNYLKLIETVYSRILAEGGLVGHLQHLYDNKDITFGEIKDILRSAASGKLKHVSEKFDGMNLVFSYDVGPNSLKVVRNASEIKKGGMNASQLASKFSGRGSVEEAFTSAFDVLQDAINTLSPEDKLELFGKDANNWYSIEVIYVNAPNVINYDSNSIVFHTYPMFKRFKNSSGEIEISRSENASQLVNVLSNHIHTMQSAASKKMWNIKGPALVSLNKISHGTILSETIQQIDHVLSNNGLTDNHSIRSLIVIPFFTQLESLNVPPQLQNSIVSRALDEPSAPTLVEIKKQVDKQTYDKIKNIIDNAKQTLKHQILPVEHAISSFSIELLRGINSSLIANPSDEINRIRAQVSRAVDAIETSDDQRKIDTLKSQLSKLKKLDNISSSMEGIVFIYKGNTYKFTGAFAPVNQILGIFKYGRLC